MGGLRSTEPLRALESRSGAPADRCSAPARRRRPAIAGWWDPIPPGGSQAGFDRPDKRKPDSPKVGEEAAFDKKPDLPKDEGQDEGGPSF
jgi:hypothetical protein